MLIVSDTTPLHYLIQIEKIDLLPQLFDEILTPIEVIEELSHPNTPQDVKAWISKSPDWLTVLPSPSDAFSRVTGLDKGETAAIALALDYQAEAILLDDRRGARSAELLGLSVITTFGVLERAAVQGLVDFRNAVGDLATTNFWLPPQEIIDDFLDRIAKNRAND
jgi:predicted nucleic acid-binding protein